VNDSAVARVKNANSRVKQPHSPMKQ